MKIFVYGTLKSGYGNNRLLQEQEFLGETRTRYPVFDMSGGGGIPFVHPEGSSHIRGELYEVDEACLDRVDGLEGHPTWYKRELVELDTGDMAFMYMMPSGSGRYLSIPNERNELWWQH